jgi:hypothetical protein
VRPHREIALDQLRLAHQQLQRLDDTVETTGQQMLLFLAAAVVHALTDAANTLQPAVPPATRALRPAEIDVLREALRQAQSR